MNSKTEIWMGAWVRLAGALTRTRAAFVVIFLLAVTVRLSLMFWGGYHHMMFRGELQRIAESLATTGVYGNPYAVPTGPTAHCSPLYTLLAALVLKLFGPGSQGELALYVFNTILAGLVYSLLPVVAASLGMNRLIGVLAGLFGALIPFHFLNELRAGDAPLSALLLMGLLVTTLKAWRRASFDWTTALGGGILWGLALLLLPPLLPLLAGTLLGGLILVRRRWWLAHSGVLLVVAFSLLLPWAVRNRLILGEFVWFRSNFGLEFRLSYNDFARADMVSNRDHGSFDLYHPFVSGAAADRVNQEGELGYNARMLREGFQWVSDHPAKSATLVVQRIRLFWFPSTGRTAQSALLALLSLSGLGGGLALLWRKPLVARLFGITWLTFPLVFYVLQSAVRYRYPLNWTLLLAAGMLICFLFERRIPGQSRPRVSSRGFNKGS